MGVAIPIAMLAMSAAGKGMQMAASNAEGIQKKTASQIESMKLKMAAEAGRVRAQQVDAQYRDELNETMQTIGAIRSAQNVGFDSPTSFALYDKAETINDRARVVAASNERLKALGLEGDAAQTLAAGRMARTTAALKMIPTGLSLGQELATGIPKLFE
ncbi:hypothetical protein [Bosea sp. BK604]|uniref:hypothetical protein n=1 Tax=Bosea sp. BK604 TaxID=2512180 RepID=UPI001052B6C7|nr:hypothetical protein [Bosea sp. BK604]TCR64696.1 hypothetical protein EV560_106162 [Bosea sp. BK604]